MFCACKGNMTSFGLSCQHLTLSLIHIFQYKHNVILSWTLGWNEKIKFGFLICNRAEKLPFGVDKIKKRYEKYWSTS